MKAPFPLLVWFGIIFTIILLGTFGFMIVEHFGFLDAFYMTVITVTTIGYEEVHPLDNAGMIFNIILIVTSFSTFTYALARLTQYVASGEMALFFKNRKLMQAISKMSDHVIICGFGRNGQQAALTLKAHKVEFVVVENDLAHINQWLVTEPTLTYVNADATEDETLVKAGIHRAKALIVALPDDADNVFIVLSARSMSPTIQIISRASQHGSAIKLKKAGADSIIMPDKIGGTHMATLVSKPDIIEFIDYLSSEDGDVISMESVEYEKLPPPLRDQALKVVMDWKKTGVNCIGIKDKEGKFIINPPEDTIISAGMKVIVLGSKNQIGYMKHNVRSAD